MTIPALLAYGYQCEDDSWKTDGRLTFVHDDNADRDFLRVLECRLMPHGWRLDTNKLRAFRHPDGLMIEIEPGGADCTGHLLHILMVRQ